MTKVMDDDLFYFIFIDFNKTNKSKYYTIIKYNLFIYFFLSFYLFKMDQQEYLSLPVYKFQQDISNKIQKFNKLIIIGETGSGKTTQVPKIILNSLSNNNKICVTQPRRVAAISVAQRVSQEIGTKIGSTIGYSVRFDERVSSSTKIKYVTDGMLLREAILDNRLSNYSTIIIDEIHERSINTDTLLALILRIQTYRKDLKLVVMSATIDLDKLKSYLKIDEENVIKIEGRSFPIEVYHTIEPQQNYIDTACSSILQIHIMDMDKEGDILVFLPGQEDIEDLSGLLESKNQLILLNKSQYPKLLSIYHLYSNLPNSEQMKIFQTVDGSKYRKVILATNIAETSLTIKNIKYVVDCGMFKTRIFDMKKDLDSLILDKINKNSAIQRTGRAGRESAGKCFRLYTEDEYKNMNDNNIPEILRVKLINLILLIKSIGFDSITDLNYLDKPNEIMLQKGYDELKQLGALDIREELTPLGKKLSVLPIDPCLAVILLNSLFEEEFKIIHDDILTIVSLLQTDNIFYSTNISREKAEQVRSKFIHVSSDHLTLLNVYKQWKEVKNDKIIKSDKWAKDNFINEKALSKAEEIKKQLERYLLSMIENQEEDILTEKKLDSFLLEKNSILLEDKIKIIEMKENLILKCLLTGYLFNVARYDSDNVFITLTGKHKCRVHPTSILIKNIKLAKASGYVIFSEIVFTSKQYLKLCSVVSKEMVEKLTK